MIKGIDQMNEQLEMKNLTCFLLLVNYFYENEQIMLMLKLFHYIIKCNYFPPELITRTVFQMTETVKHVAQYWKCSI